MTLSLTLEREEFAAKRRDAQTRYEERLRPAIREALSRDDWGPVLVVVRDIYADAYFEETGDRDAFPPPAGWMQKLEDTLEKTKGDQAATVDRIALWLGAAVLNVASIEAARADPEALTLEWVTMHDNDVRTEHRAADGQVRPPGEMFTVGGHDMEYPGDSRAPIHLWINCRCTLRPRLATEASAMVASSDSEPKNNQGGNVDPETETPAEDQTEQPEEESAGFAAVPWHGVLAPEGINSGDGRRFANNSLSFRPLPLPLTWQKVSDDGHKGNVTVAKIESIQRVGSEMRATGHFLSNVEADEVVGLIAEFGKFGVSVDADDATFELADDDEVVEFTQARISSACIVPIPAFAEAWAALGEAPEGFLDGEDPEIVGEPDEALTAALVVAGRGPGWLTNPEDTRRLHDYWTKGEGAAKVNWGVPGDFNRCRVEVGEEIGENSPDKLRFINQICAQWHHDALGYWPGRPTSGDTEQFAGEKMELEDTAMESVHLVASGIKRAPAEWFENPNLTEPTPLTVTDDGRVFGHIAAWTSCHIGYEDMCVAPPHSASDYSYFLGGQVPLDNGKRANTGVLSIGGGHAGPRLSARAAMAHYDSTSAAVADVTCGEDEHGIWFSGWVRPGVSDEMVTALMASKLSGDWRTIQGEMELVAALAVNVPGFGINRPRIAASSQGQLSLVASGVVNKSERDKPVGIDYDLLAEKVAAQIANREGRKAKMAALAARLNGGK